MTYVSGLALPGVEAHCHDRNNLTLKENTALKLHLISDFILEMLGHYLIATADRKQFANGVVARPVENRATNHSILGTKALTFQLRSQGRLVPGTADE